MIYLPQNALQRLWLLLLLGVWAALLFGGFVFGTPASEEARWMPTWTRMGSSLTLVAIAWSWILFSRGAAVCTFAVLVAVGMTLGCLGDFFNADLILSDPRDSTLAGMAAFGVGHVAYIAAFLLFGNRCGLAAPRPRYGAWLAWLVVGVVGWYGMVFHGQEPTLLHWAALPYALLLASTAGFATALALQAPAFTGLAVGAALFLLSDLILAGQLFNRQRFDVIHIGDVVWLTYGPGQMLIVYAVGAAQRTWERGARA